MSESEIKEAIRDYFGQNKYNMSLSMYGKVACISIEYSDFVPQYQVLIDLMQRVPVCDISLHRHVLSS